MEKKNLKLVKAVGINWDTDNEHIEYLPTEEYLCVESEDEVANMLSDKHGFCVESIKEIVTFTPNEQGIVLVELNTRQDWNKMGDSMCYDSGTYVFDALVLYKDKLFYIEEIANGHVKVYYNDIAYKCASAMPEELLEKFKDGTAYTSEEIDEIVENNWWEIFYDYVPLSMKGVVDFDFACHYSYIPDQEPKDFGNEQELTEYLFENAIEIIDEDLGEEDF